MRVAEHLLSNQPILRASPNASGTSTEADFWGGFGEGQEYAESFGCIHRVGLCYRFSVTRILSIHHVPFDFKVAAARSQGANEQSKLRKSASTI